MLNRISQLSAIIFVVLLSVTLVAVPLYDFYQNQYSWQFHLPSFMQGGIELLSIAVVLSVCGLIPGHRWKYVVLIGLTEAYLRRHNADLALLVAFLFAESLIGLGYIFFRTTTGFRIPTLFITGACLLVLISMGLSIFDSAKMVPLLTISFIVALIFYVSSFKESLLFALIGASKHIFFSDHLTKLASLSLYVCLLMLAAKTAYKLNYDETWYSLRLAEDLNANGSFFEDLKLLGNWVHQYPKFFEILIFPLQYFESFTVSKVFSVVVLGIGLIAANEFWGGYHLSDKKRILMSSVLASIPVVAGNAISAKADMFSGFVFLLSVFYFLKGAHERSSGLLLLSIGALALTLAIKLTAVGYMPIFILVYAYVVFALRDKLDRVSGSHFAMAMVFIAVLCAVTLRTYVITGVPFVSIADASPSIATLYELLGFEYKYPYSPISDFVVFSNKTDSLTLILNSFIFPTKVRQSFNWISNIAIPFLAMAVIWSLKYRHGKYEALLVIISVILIIGFIGLVFNNDRLMGGDGSYYLIPILVIVAVGGTSFRWMPQYSLSIVLLCSIYVVANLPIAFVSSLSWYPGTRALDFVFNQCPFNKSKTQNETLCDYGMRDMRAYFDDLKQDACVAIGDGGVALYHLGCRMETVSSIFSARPGLNSSAESFANMLKEKKATHLIMPNYIPDSYYGRFCQSLTGSRAAKITRFDYYSVIDIRGIAYKELKRHADVAFMPVDVIYLDSLLPHKITSLNGANEEVSGRVDLSPSKSGIRTYYRSTDKVIFIKPNMAIKFIASTQGRCVAGFEAYFAKHIQRTGRILPGGKFSVTISSESGILGDGVFSIYRNNQLFGKLPLNAQEETIVVDIKYESDRRKLKPSIPAVIVNPRLRYCE